MKILYFECNMGAAGDMLSAALLDLLPEPQKFMEKLNSLGLSGIEYTLEKRKKCGVLGSYVKVLVNGEAEGEHHHHEHEHTHHHHHSTLKGIKDIVNTLDIDSKVKNDIISVFGIIAAAESTVHGEDIDEIHFHEVGTMDAIADVTAVCMLINEINPEKIIVSPICTGSGTVKCAHGILPVPAPATALILKGVPNFSGEIKSELCTPTGAALLKYFADEFCPYPVSSYEKIGYGFGTKDFDVLNCVRVFLGETIEENPVFELSFNIDDMTAEEIAFAGDLLLQNGALDVFKSPVYMKKNRLGTLVTVLCKEQDKVEMVKLIFRHTSTIGIRERRYNRFCMEREIREISTKYGNIKVKFSKGFDVERAKPEYEDISFAAKKYNVTLEEVEKAVFKALKE